MANLSKSVVRGACFNVTVNKNPPTPNTGVSWAETGAFTFSNPYATVLQLGSDTARIQATVIGQTVLTVKSKNASGVEFIDTVTITVTNPIPDATESGIQLGDVYFV